MTNLDTQTTLTNFDTLGIAKFFFLLFIISIFFPIRYVFPTSFSFATGLYSDFTSISLYSSDIFLFIAFFFALWSNNWNFKLWLKNKQILIFIIWLILDTFLFHKSISSLNMWYFAKFIELAIVSYGTTKLVFSDQSLVIRKLFLLIFVSLGTLQSVIGLLQFINQSPIGLNLIGEQIIYPNLWGVAKIVADGTAYIRAYGTFPHPNLLSSFLVVTILINLYLLTSTMWNRFIRTWLNLALFVNILGLTVTFSRGASLALVVGLIVYFGFLIIKRRKLYKLHTNDTNHSFVMVIVSVVASFALFRPFLLTRATVSDQATVERRIYNQTALNIIKNKPIFGLGAGESVLHMKQYSPVPLNPRQIQPIHNFFLLAAAEIGIPGMLILLWIFISHLKKLVSSIKYQVLGNSQTLATYYLLLTTVLCTFLVLMLFDHYFYTLQQTQMLLWLILAMIAAEIKSSKISI